MTDAKIFEIALRVMSEALDALVIASLDPNGNAKAPSKKAIMRARAILPPYCAMALTQRPAEGAPKP